VSSLIEFLTRNWYIVIILIALFSQLRGKARSKQQVNPNNRMPAFGGGEPARRPQPDVKGVTGSGKPIAPLIQTKREATQVKGKTLIESVGSLSASKELPYLENRERSSSPFSQSSDSNYSSIQEKSEIDAIYASEAALNGSLSASKEQLAQGIIWAEILGPPRAKKPYRR
jgi:hypothetical protein